MSASRRKRLVLFWYGVGLVTSPERQRFNYNPRLRLARPALSPRPMRLVRW